jgi:hypothetical protein
MGGEFWEVYYRMVPGKNRKFISYYKFDPSRRYAVPCEACLQVLPRYDIKIIVVAGTCSVVVGER